MCDRKNKWRLRPQTPPFSPGGWGGTACTKPSSTTKQLKRTKSSVPLPQHRNPESTEGQKYGPRETNSMELASTQCSRSSNQLHSLWPSTPNLWPVFKLTLVSTKEQTGTTYVTQYLYIYICIPYISFNPALWSRDMTLFLTKQSKTAATKTVTATVRNAKKEMNQEVSSLSLQRTILAAGVCVCVRLRCIFVCISVRMLIATTIPMCV